MKEKYQWFLRETNFSLSLSCSQFGIFFRHTNHWRFLCAANYRMVKVKKRVIRVTSFIPGAKNPGAACRELARRKSSLSYPFCRHITRRRERDKEAAAAPVGASLDSLPIYWDARTLPRRYPKRRRITRERATLHRRDRDPQKRTLWREHWERRPDLAVPTCFCSYQECGYLSGCSADFFHLLIVLPWISVPNSFGLHALYSLVLRMLPTRLNGSLVRSCTRLLRLLAATCCSWHSYLNVISIFLRTAGSYSCTHYMASPIPVSHFNQYLTAVNPMRTIAILSYYQNYWKFKDIKK